VDTDTKYQATSKSGLEVSCVNYGELLVTTLCLKKPGIFATVTYSELIN